MKKDQKNDGLREEYDLSKLTGRVRGKYVERYEEGTNLILLDDDVANAFPTTESVNDALRQLLRSSSDRQKI